MNDQKNKKRWAEEAQKLKADLDNRQKIVQKREVPIRLTKDSASKKPQSSQPQPPTQGASEADDVFRQRLGL